MYYTQAGRQTMQPAGHFSLSRLDCYYKTGNHSLYSTPAVEPGWPHLTEAVAVAAAAIMYSVI